MFDNHFRVFEFLHFDSGPRRLSTGRDPLFDTFIDVWFFSVVCSVCGSRRPVDNGVFFPLIDFVFDCAFVTVLMPLFCR